MPEKRAYTVEFLSIDRPSAVMVNGQRLTNGTWNYNSQSRMVTVFVPATDCDKEITVKLQP